MPGEALHGDCLSLTETLSISRADGVCIAQEPQLRNVEGTRLADHVARSVNEVRLYPVRDLAAERFHSYSPVAEPRKSASVISQAPPPPRSSEYFQPSCAPAYSVLA